MAIPVLNHMDFQQVAEIRNVRLHNSSEIGSLSSGNAGLIIFDSGTVKVWSGSAWVSLAAGTSGEINQNAFSNIAVSGQTTVAADAKTDTVTFVAGSNVTITTNATNDEITFASTDTNTTYGGGTGLTLSGTTFNANVDGTQSVAANASSTASGRTYKVQVDGGDNLVVNVPWVDTDTVYTHPTQSAISIDTANAEVLDTLTVNTLGHVTGATKRTMTLANLGYLGDVNANNYSFSLADLKTVIQATLSDLTIGAGTDTITIPGDLVVTGTTTTNNVETVSTTNGVVFEGTTADGFDMTLLSVVSGSSKTVTLPNIAGYVPIMNTSPGTTVITATAAELNYVDGVTSNIQTQLNAKQDASTALTTSTSFGGDVSGTYNNIVIADDSHNHTIGNVDGLQTALDAKAPLASPALTGTPTAPSASGTTDSTQIATTAFTQDAIDARSYSTTVGNGSLTSIEVTHNLGSRNVIVQLFDSSSYETVLADVVRTTTNTVDLTFASAPSTGDVTVLIYRV